MNKSNIMTAICVISSLIGVHHALLDYPLINILIPWFAVPLAAILVFWGHGDTPEVSTYKVLDSITETTLSDIQTFCRSYRTGNEYLDSSASSLSQQAASFRKLTSDLDEVFCTRAGAATSETYNAQIRRTRDSFIRNSTRVMSRLRTVRSALEYSGDDLKTINVLLDENRDIITGIKALVDAVSEYSVAEDEPYTVEALARYLRQ